jgi:hypothetical protein
MGANFSIANLLESKCLYLDDKRNFDIICVLGQSNAVGQGLEYSFAEMLNHNNKISSNKIFQLGRGKHSRSGFFGGVNDENHVIEASDPLETDKFETVSNGGTIGFATTTAKLYTDKYLPNSNNRSLLIVQCSFDATGFSDNSWNPGNRSFNEAVRRIKIALNLGGNNKVVGILWDQGETDALNFMKKNDYNIALRTMINKLRNGVTIPGVNSNTPFILGEMCYSDFSGGRSILPAAEQEFKDIQSVILDISNPQSGLPKTATVSASLDGTNYFYQDENNGLPPNPTDILGKPFKPGHPDIHFSAPSFEILGQRYFAALDKLINE